MPPMHLEISMHTDYFDILYVWTWNKIVLLLP